MTTRSLSPSAIARLGLGLPPAEGPAADNDTTCMACGATIAAGEPAVPWKPSKSTFTDWPHLERQTGVVCRDCGPFLENRVLTKTQKCVVSRAGAWSLAKDAHRVWWLTDPPKTPFVAVISDSMKQHLVWRAQPTLDRDLLHLQLGRRTLTIDRPRALEAVDWCREIVDVARVDEAIELREASVDKTIILLEGIRSAEELMLASQYKLSPVFHSDYQLDYLEEVDLKQPLTDCWLMLETGMHRLGVKADLAADFLAKLNASEKVDGDVGLMSHFANSDSVDDPRNDLQLEQLSKMTSASSLISMANSGAIIAIPDSHHDWVRPGIMLYGSSPFTEKSAADLGLKPVMKFFAKVSSVQHLSAGDQVGYGGDYIADKAMVVATVSVGYGDGYHRSLAETGYVDINGQLAKLVGRVSMDMICVDVTDIDVEVGDEVVLWGSDLLSIDTVAKWANTISYELLCHVTNRVTRIYG